MFSFKNLEGVRNTVKNLESLEGKVFTREGNTNWKGLYFTLYVPIFGDPYFAYCDRDGNPKIKTGKGYDNGHEFSTVGGGVLAKNDIIEIGEREMTEFLNLSGVSLTIEKCESTDFENKPKWIGKWYNTEGMLVATTEYKRKKDAIAQLKAEPTRKLVMYRVGKVFSVDMPIVEKEV
jgi:hypothetical protein